MRHENLPLEKQKSYAFAALNNYVKALHEVHDYNGLRELRYMLKGFADNLRYTKRHRKQKA